LLVSGERKRCQSATPRRPGWAPTAIREMLHREMYRGVIVWNRTQIANRRRRRQVSAITDRMATARRQVLC
jgi:hypothetical protein